MIISFSIILLSGNVEHLDIIENVYMFGFKANRFSKFKP